MTTFTKKLFGVFAALTIVQGASTLPAIAKQAAYQRIESSAALRDSLVGRPLSQNGEAIVLNADGSFGGTFRGRNYHGSWNWNAEYSTICIFSKVPIERYNCSIIEVDPQSQRVDFRRHPVQRVPSDFFNYMPIFSSNFSY